MKTIMICRKPYIDLTFTGEWRFGKENWSDTHHFVEYYIGPLLIRHFYEKMEINSNSVR